MFINYKCIIRPHSRSYHPHCRTTFNTWFDHDFPWFNTCESPEINTLFSGFSYMGPAILLNIMIAVFTCLWSLLFVIPGIIKAISYSMAYFVLADNPELSAKEALDESKRITSGHIGDLFVLYLSFIPWVLLGAITCGLALIYVVPYMQTTMANYYLELKNN